MNLKEIKTYHNKEKTKIFEIYFEDEKGNLQGVSKLYDTNGKLVKLVSYVDDKRHGIAITPKYIDIYQDDEIIESFTKNEI
jgi:antitoxin component YwqK of YwqJK toxin-antitoxin module